MNFSVALSFVGTMIYLGSFTYYITLVVRGGVRPNASTWFVWAMLGILNALTYQTLSADWVKSLMAYGGCLANALTFLTALKLGRFAPLDRIDKIVAVIGVIVAIIWVINQHAPYANALVMCCVVISTAPTLRGVWIEPGREKALPWLLLGVSYIFPLVVVLLRWNQIWDLMFPVVGLIANSSVGLLSLRHQGE